MRVLFVVLIAWSGCASTRHPASTQEPAATVQAPRFTPDTYLVRIKAATIEARRKDGSPWHVTKPNNTAIVVGAAVTTLTVGNPQPGIEIGQRFADAGGDPRAPLPYVVVKIDGNTWTVDPSDRTYSPTWNQPFDLPAMFDGTETVVIQVIDATDSALIGQTQMTLAELVSRRGQTLTNFGSVSSLDLEAEPYDPDQGHDPDQDPATAPLSY